MALVAEQVLRSGDLVAAITGSALEDNTTGSTNEDDWGSPVRIPNPNAPVTVVARMTGRLRSAVTNTTAIFRVYISLDGGGTFTVGNAPQLNTTQAATTKRTGTAAECFLSGTPTDDIVAKATIDTSGAGDPVVTSGFLTVEVLANP